MNQHTRHRRFQGFSLIELMIAMTLGLVLIAGVLTVMLSQRTSSRLEDTMARMQENARVAFDILARDIRMAGGVGCARDSDIYTDLKAVNVIAHNPPANVIGTANQGIQGFDAGDYDRNPSGLLATADAIRLSGMTDCGAQLTGNTAPNNANIQLSGANTCGWEAGSLLFITDCRTADLFRATNVSEGGARVTIAHANNQNTTNKLSKSYKDDSFILSYTTKDYYLANNDQGLPALYRWDGVAAAAAATDEIVAGVQDMQFLFGVSPTGSQADGTIAVAAYCTAAAINGGTCVVNGTAQDWGRVYTVRVQLLMQSEANNILDEPQLYTNLQGTAVTPTDRRLRRVFDYVVNLRN